MFTRRALLAAAIVFGVSTPVSTAENLAFTQADFAKAQADGRSILVEIHAPWCSICMAQQPILDRLERDPNFASLTVLRIDFDSQKSAVRSFKATSQSTLIVFKGSKETGRSVGDTDPTSIAALLDKAL
jgi:thiol-disulfide isomerase/thioredoxin